MKPMVNTIDVLFAILPLTKYARDEAGKGEGRCPTKQSWSVLSVRCHILAETVIVKTGYCLLGKLYRQSSKPPHRHGENLAKYHIPSYKYCTGTSRQCCGSGRIHWIRIRIQPVAEYGSNPDLGPDQDIFQQNFQKIIIGLLEIS